MITKHLLCAAACAALTLPAMAQSTVTVFGRLDLALRHVRNQGVGSLNTMANTGNSSSRFGVRGVEDLGDGWSAGFWLESSVGVDVGSGGASNTASTNQFWDRESYVFLAKRTLGELRLGYDLTQLYNTWTTADPFSHVGVGGTSNLYQATQTGPIRAAFGSDRGLSTTVRSRNMIQYFLPAGLGGFKGGLFYAPSEGGTVAANAASKYAGGTFGYAAGPVDIQAGYGTSKTDLTGGDKFKESLVTGIYDLGVVKLGASWRQFEFRTAKQTMDLLSATSTFGAHTFKASRHHSNMQGTVGTTNISANDATQFALGYVYDLSKRTALYATYAEISNKGLSTTIVSGGPAVTAATFGGKKSTGMDFGLRHIF